MASDAFDTIPFALCASAPSLLRDFVHPALFAAVRRLSYLPLLVVVVALFPEKATKKCSFVICFRSGTYKAAQTSLLAKR